MDGFSAESGAQLLARITSESRPLLKDLCPEIIPNHGPSQKDVIEITGESNVGKTILLMELIAQAVLPVECGGKNASAIVIDTNSNFQTHRLAPILEKHILHSHMVSSKSNETEDLRAETSNVKDIVLDSLKSVMIFKCYSSTDLNMVLWKIEEILTTNSKISVIALDCISSFYWLDMLNADPPIRMDTYLRKLLDRFRKIIDQTHVVLIYTRPTYFISAKRERDPDKQPKIDYRIELVSKNAKNFEANVIFSEQSTFKRKYTINDFGIEWISSTASV